MLNTGFSLLECSSTNFHNNYISSLQWLLNSVVSSKKTCTTFSANQSEAVVDSSQYQTCKCSLKWRSRGALSTGNVFSWFLKSSFRDMWAKWLTRHVISFTTFLSNSYCHSNWRKKLGSVSESRIFTSILFTCVVVYRDPSEIVRPRVSMTACIEAFAAPEIVDDFYSTALQAKSVAQKWVADVMSKQILSPRVVSSFRAREASEIWTYIYNTQGSHRPWKVLEKLLYPRNVLENGKFRFFPK